MSENSKISNLNGFQTKILNKSIIGNKYLMDKEIIGSGSTCQVFKAINLTNKTTVAIKRIYNLSKDYQLKMNFHQQISILNSINHPNIVNLIQVLEIQVSNKKELYMVFQYLPFTLRDILVKRRLLTENQVQHIIIQILNGLQYLDQHHILHRDLKPQNILICQKLDTVKICDFGLAIVCDPHKKEKQQKLGHRIMTRWYRAPQVILLLSEYSTKIDMWSLGCILAELIQSVGSRQNSKKKVLFSGKACFPLSPPSKNVEVSYEMKNGFPHSSKDQLFKIIQILGTPDDTDFIGQKDKRSQKYLLSFERKQKIPFSQILSEIPQWADYLLEMILKINPDSRVSARQALAYLTSIFKVDRTIGLINYCSQQPSLNSWMQKICQN